MQTAYGKQFGVKMEFEELVLISVPPLPHTHTHTDLWNGVSQQEELAKEMKWTCAFVDSQLYISCFFLSR